MACHLVCSKTMNNIMAKGHSRIPVYAGDPTNIIGLVLVRSRIHFPSNLHVGVAQP